MRAVLASNGGAACSFALKFQSPTDGGKACDQSPGGHVPRGHRVSIPYRRGQGLRRWNDLTSPASGIVSIPYRRGQGLRPLRCQPAPRLGQVSIPYRRGRGLRLGTTVLGKGLSWSFNPLQTGARPATEPFVSTWRHVLVSIPYRRGQGLRLSVEHGYYLCREFQSPTDGGKACDDGVPRRNLRRLHVSIPYRRGQGLRQTLALRQRLENEVSIPYRRGQACNSART